MKLTQQLLVFLLLTFFSSLKAQTTISGTISDANKEPLLGATITLSKSYNSNILAHGTSDVNGKFNVRISSALDSLYVSVSHLGFKEWTKTISNKSNKLVITLEESSISLDEVVLKLESIEKKGDTLNYSVASFKDKDDRVIADVIKKLPGIEVKPSGEIFYQGKPIQKYYIEGLDLLEGRYNLANNNLSANAVSKIQILENHQPIKVLDSLSVSDRASLNVKLHKNIALTGSGKLAAGFPNLLWDVALTPILFSKKQQFLASFQTNNIGDDLLNEISSFAVASNANSLQLTKKRLLNNINPTNPPFGKDRWLDNNAHLATVNSLFRLKSSIDLKLNTSYFNDSQLREGSSLTTYYTPNDTISIQEIVKSNAFKQHLNSNIILEKNTKTTYFKNTLKYKGIWDTFRGSILRDSLVSESLELPYLEVKNSFESYITLGKQLLSLESIIGYNESSSELAVLPGQFSIIPNTSSILNRQVLNNKGFSFFNSIGITKKLNNFNISSDLETEFSNENLNSILLSESQPFNDAINDISLKKFKTALNSKLSFEKNNWKLRLLVPFSFLSIKIDNEITDARTKDEFIVVEPRLLVEKKISPFWSINNQYYYTQNFGQISQLYSGYILTNYRALNRFNAPLLNSRNHNASLGINYRNPLKAIFAIFSYSLNYTKSNLLFSTDISDEGQLIYNALEQDNAARSNNYSLSFSKRLKRMNGLININLSHSRSKASQLLNQRVLKVKGNGWSIRSGIDADITSWLGASIKSNLNWSSSKIGTISPNSILSQKHTLQNHLYFSKKQLLSVINELYSTSTEKKNDTNYFLNLKYQYSFPKKKIDLYVKWLNVLNENKYVSYSNTEYLVSLRTFIVRPSQVLLGVKISL